MVIPDNLKGYLSSEEVQVERRKGKGVYLGRRFTIDNSEHLYNSGGPGYVLDSIALSLLVQGLNGEADMCKTHVETSVEDLYTANCLRNTAEIYPLETRDHTGRERFHHFTPAMLNTYTMKRDEYNRSADWWVVHSLDFRTGPDCCSCKSVSFHMLQPLYMRAVYSYLYSCRSETPHVIVGDGRDGGDRRV